MPPRLKQFTQVMDVDEVKGMVDDSPVAWFFMLERAIRCEHYEDARQADEQLRRLGVQVKFHGDRWRQPISI